VEDTGEFASAKASGRSQLRRVRTFRSRFVRALRTGVATVATEEAGIPKSLRNVFLDLPESSSPGGSSWPPTRPIGTSSSTMSDTGRRGNDSTIETEEGRGSESVPHCGLPTRDISG